MKLVENISRITLKENSKSINSRIIQYASRSKIRINFKLTKPKEKN